MIERTLKTKVIELAGKYPVVTLTGPRQSGKSTLLKSAFPDYQYVSLEDLDQREFATNDPRGFLSTYPRCVIIDEAQRVPSLFSYIQTHVDKLDETGVYLLAGSHNFLLMESVNQSLAGRTAILKLLPFSHEEMVNGNILPDDINKEIFYGSYPRIFDKEIAPKDFYPYYIQTYVEKDVRLLKNIGNLSLFIRFIKLCAGRILSVLEASYICYLLRPDWNNYAKRLVKTPKLYFYDTGLACSLLDIKSVEQVNTHFLRGGLFENMVINSFVKRAWNVGEEPDIRFWRDSQGNEVDFLLYSQGQPMAYEIKSSATFSADFFDGLVKWSKLSGASSSQLNVIYGGDSNLNTSNGQLCAWNKL